MLRGKDDYLRQRAIALKAEENIKWDPESLERRLQAYNANNDVGLFIKANTDP